MRIGIIFLLILSTVILLEIYQNQEISASPLQEYCEYKKSINDSYICPNQPSPSEQQLDVIWYGPEIGNYGINFLSHFEDLGLTFEHRTLGPIQNLNAKSVFVLFTTTGEKGEMGFTNSEVTNMVNFVKNGGQLILGADTNYAYCLPDTQCAFDFTIEKFGFKFGGDVQRGILVPEENNKEHPIWNSVYQLDSFNDWGFDAYIIDIMDSENIQIVSRVSSQSYNEYTGFTSVQDVPAIIVNENPSFNGGKVIAGGYNMIVGLGNISLLDNILSFVLDRPLEKNELKKTAIDSIPKEPIDTKINSLKTQIKNGVKPQNISCTGNLQLIFKHDNSPSCVKPESIPKLIERGWTNVNFQPVYSDKQIEAGLPNWGIGENLQQGDFFSYSLCHKTYKECQPFEISLWIKDYSEDNSQIVFTVYDGNKEIKNKFELENGHLTPTDPQNLTLLQYIGLFKETVLYLDRFASVDGWGNSSPKSFSAKSWGTYGKISGNQFVPSGVEEIRVPSGTYESNVITFSIGKKTNKIWVVDEIPFPVKADVWSEVYEPVQEYRFVLLQHGNSSEDPFAIHLYSPSKK